jgi:hypothetical protein
MSELVLMVNSIKLTKLERDVLLVLSQAPDSEYYPEGNDIYSIAKKVFGDAVLDCERRGGHHCSDLRLAHAAKSSISRTLKNLFHKGLVKRCIPIYHYGWTRVHFRDGTTNGFYGKLRDLQFLKAASINEHGLCVVEKLAFKELPDRCHVWWILTEKGKQRLNEA